MAGNRGAPPIAPLSLPVGVEWAGEEGGEPISGVKPYRFLKTSATEFTTEPRRRYSYLR